MLAMLTMAASRVRPLALQQMRERGVGGVERGKEVSGHGAAVGVEGLVFDGADFDDACVIDENVDAPELGDGVFDELDSLGGVGEVGWDEENVVGGLDGVAFEQAFAGLDELFGIAGDEDETGAGASVALGEGETKAAGASGDEYRLCRGRGCVSSPQWSRQWLRLRRRLLPRWRQLES